MSTITELNPRLLALTEAGVSVWLDQIRRSVVEGGELARMVAVESLRGVTSNPAMFEKANLGSTDYDDDLRALARENLDSQGQRVDRVNVMIKIPGAPEGVPAIERALYEGINVNVTFAMAVAGWALEINLFDQPNVQEAKDNTRRVLESGSVPSIGLAGDLETLRSHGLAAERVELDGDPAEAVRALTRRITAIRQES